MRLAISNIAWPRSEDEAVAAMLVRLGVTAIEVAPTKLWQDLLAVTDEEVDSVRRFWADRGIAIVAAQSLLFGRPDLLLFDSGEVRARTFDYLAHVVRICARLGAGALVFGAPKNRRIEQTPPKIARDIAIDFFGQLGEVAEAAGTTVVLEANPPQYGADFVVRAAEAIDLVRAVNHPGFRLHLDTACMHLAGDAIRQTLDDGFAYLGHFHVSEPNLGLPGSSSRVDHAAFARELTYCGYDGVVSLEMREPADFSIDAVASAMRWLTDRYGGATLAERRIAG
jgi:sugar phosphate isomerase/epimerase